jgi:hypothetical protein
LRVVEVAGRDLRRGFLLNIENVKVRAPAIQVADRISLELQAIDDKGRRSFRFCSCSLVLVFPGLCIFGLRILDRHHQPGAVRRPLKIADTLRNIRQSNSLTSEPIEQPDLALAAIAGRSKRQIFVIGAPARVARRSTLRCHRKSIATARRNHPDPRFVLVFLQHFRAHGISDPLPIGAQLRLPHISNLKIVVNRDVA